VADKPPCEPRLDPDPRRAAQPSVQGMQERLESRTLVLDEADRPRQGARLAAGELIEQVRGEPGRTHRRRIRGPPGSGSVPADLLT
jgi:hypothetical protein